MRLIGGLMSTVTPKLKIPCLLRRVRTYIIQISYHCLDLFTVTLTFSSISLGHCNTCPRSTPSSQLNIDSTSLGNVPAASTNHSLPTYTSSLALNSMSTATNALPEPTPYSFVLSSSLIR